MNPSQLHLKIGIIISFSVSYLWPMERWYAYSNRSSDTTSLSGFASTPIRLAGNKKVSDPIKSIPLRDASLQLQLQLNKTINYMSNFVRKRGR